MRTLYLLSVWLHIIAAAVWIGGTVFLALVLAPAIRRPEFQSLGAALIAWTGRRFRHVGWASLAVLVVTGIFNLVYRQFPFADLASARGWTSASGRTLGVKLLLVVAILLLSVAHDLVIGRRAMAAWHEAPGSLEARRLRRQAGWIGRVNLLLALAVAALGVLLVRGRP